MYTEFKREMTSFLCVQAGAVRYNKECASKRVLVFRPTII